MGKGIFTLWCAIFFVVHFSVAQDIIYLKNGDEIEAKVLTVDITEVTYKKWNNQDGPTYRIAKRELLMIKYENGSKDVFGENDLAPTSKSTNGQYDRHMEKYGKSLSSGIAISATGGAMLISGLALTIHYGDLHGQYALNKVPNHIRGGLAGGILLLIASIPLNIVGPIKLGRAFVHKRRAQDSMAFLSFGSGMSPLSSGITLPPSFYGQSGVSMKITF